MRDGQSAIAFTRALSRDTLRLAAFLSITPFCAVLASTGSADFSASFAAALFPALIASSTSRTAPRARDVRYLLISVRRTAWRAAFFADFVLAMLCLVLDT